jgi:UDP-glucose 4-epimerase
VIPAFTQAALDGAPLPVQGDGLQTRDFTFVDSVTQILARAATERVASDMPVNLAFGSRRSLLDVIAELEGVLGRSLEIEHLPPRVGDVRDSQADNALLRQLFPGIEPVDFEVGLRRTVEWFQTR